MGIYLFIYSVVWSYDFWLCFDEDSDAINKMFASVTTLLVSVE